MKYLNPKTSSQFIVQYFIHNAYKKKPELSL